MAPPHRSDTDDAPAHRMVGQYDLLECIGQGGMGVIYRARDVSLDRIVALKILREDLQTQPDVVTRFHREARAAARLNHPNIVQIYSVGHIDGLPYIAMEFVKGQPLSALVQQAGHLPWRRALHIAEQVARALACAHEAQVIHRDIKPSNILLDEEGRAYVTDFGIAKILSVREQLTVDGSRLGTPQYMSPERCRDEEVVAASDIYSLGVVLFQMIAGRLPHEATSSVELVRKILSEPPARLRQFVPTVPESVERLVAYLIEKRPADRPDSAERVCEAIHLVLQGRPLDEIRIPMRSALEEFRRSGVDAPAFTAADATTRFLPDTALARFTLRWFGTSRPWRVAVALAAVVAAGVALGSAVDHALREDPRITAAQELRRDVSPWEQSPEAGQMQRDAAGGFRLAFDFPAFRVERLQWGRDTLFVEMAGAEELRHDLVRVICSATPSAESVAVSVPPWTVPTRIGPGEPPALIGTTFLPLIGADAVLVRVDRSRPGADSGLYLCGPRGAYEPLRLLLSAQAGLRVAAVDAPASSVNCGAISQDGNRAAFAVRDAGPDDWRITELASEPDGTWRRRAVTSGGPSIDAVLYAPNGLAMLFVRRVSSSYSEIRMQPVGAANPDPVRVAAGNLRVTPGAFSPNSGRLVYETQAGFGEPRLRLLTLDGNGDPDDLGVGTSPHWHPTGAFIVALARDGSNQHQLFAVRATAPYPRRQLTFAPNGLAAPACVSGDGAWAAAPMDGADPPSVLVVGLGTVRFQ